MEKEKRILFYFVGWFIVAICIFLIGVINVKANTIDYENIGMLSNYTIFYSQDTSSNPEFQQLTQYEYYNLMNVSALLIDIDTFEFKSGVTYDLEVYLPANSVKNNVNFIVTDSNYNQCTTYELFIEDEHYPRFRFSCPSDTIGIDMYIYNDSEDYVINNGNFSWHYTYLRKQVSTINLGPIIDQNNQIIQGQEEIKDTIKEELNTCRDSVNLFNPNNILPFGFGNNMLTEFSSYKSFYLPCKPGDVFSVSRNDLSNNRFRVMFSSEFPADNVPIFGGTGNTTKYDSALSIENIVAPENANYIIVYLTNNNSPLPSELQIQKGPNSTKYEPYGEKICSNKIDQTNDILDNLQDSITDSSSPDIDGLADSAGWLPPGPLDSVLNLPLSLFNSLTTNLNKSCSPISIPLPYVNENLTIPCINTLYDKIGVSTFITWLGVIVSGFMLYTYLLKLYKWIEDRISLNETHSVDDWGGL